MNKELHTRCATQEEKEEAVKKIKSLEEIVLAENRWDTWHVGGVKEHLSSSTKDA
jgi:hypothetical protein